MRSSSSASARPCGPITGCCRRRGESRAAMIPTFGSTAGRAARRSAVLASGWQRLAASPVTPPAISAVLAGLTALVGWRGADTANHLFRIELFRKAGFTVWDTAWFGGHYLPGYSVLLAPLGALLGPAGLGAVSAVMAATCFDQLLRTRLGPRLRRRLLPLRGRHGDQPDRGEVGVRARAGPGPGRAARRRPPPWRRGRAARHRDGARQSGGSLLPHVGLGRARRERGAPLAAGRSVVGAGRLLRAPGAGGRHRLPRRRDVPVPLVGAAPRPHDLRRGPRAAPKGGPRDPGRSGALRRAWRWPCSWCRTHWVRT